MLVLKTLHIFGASLFIGNIIVSAFWKVMADRTNSIATIQYAIKLLNQTDSFFTGLGATLLVVSGHMLAENFGGVLSQQWIIQSYILFGISGLLWIAVLVPIQIKQSKLIRNLQNTDSIPEQYLKLAKLWSIIGTIATIVPLPAIYIMVTKGV